MVNNSININKTNDHLSSSLTEHNEKTTTYGLENPYPGLEWTQKCDDGIPVSYSKPSA